MAHKDRPSERAIEVFQRRAIFANDEYSEPSLYPRMWNLSAGSLYRGVVRATNPDPPEYVTVRLSGEHKFAMAVCEWNILWESAQFRRRFFHDGELPTSLRKVADSGDVNVMFVPRTRTRYYEYAPLFHLLPRSTVERFGLPLLRGGSWPFLINFADVDKYLPPDFESRLTKSWASAVWRHLIPSSPMRGFNRSDPIRLLAHNLDFWLPAVTEVIQGILRDFPEIDNGVQSGPPSLADGSFLEGAVAANPRVGADLWRGEKEATDTIALVVEQADADGRLRGILDAVRSNRVEDDFSQCWTHAREDFERKLHHKRAKVSVRFVEMTDTVPVQSPETEVIGSTVIADFLALLDSRNRQIVVLLQSGHTKLADIADILGYRSHSAVSKRLGNIRRQAEQFFDLS